MTRKSAADNPLSDPRDSLPEIVMVYWRDSAYVGDYDTAAEAWPYCLLYTTGFLIREDAEGIVFGAEIADIDDKTPRFRHVISIPKENIISIQRFKPEVGTWP